VRMCVRSRVDSSETIAVRVARRGFAALSKRVPDQYHFTVLGVLFRTFPLPSVPQKQRDRQAHAACHA